MAEIDAELAELREQFRDMRARIESLEHENAALRADAGASARAAVGSTGPVAAPGDGTVSRRHLLTKLAGAAAAGVGLAAVGTAANPRSSDAAPSPGTDGTSSAAAAESPLYGYSEVTHGVQGESSAVNGFVGVLGTHTNGGYGVRGKSLDGFGVSASGRVGLDAFGTEFGARAGVGSPSNLPNRPLSAAVAGDSAAAPGVVGSSANNDGVKGISGNDAFSGVYAENRAKGYGLFARSAGGTAVDAATTGTGVAVRAASVSAAAIVSQSTQDDGAHLVSNAVGRSGVYGENTGAGYGVYGGSLSGVGVVARGPLPLWLIPSATAGAPSSGGQVGQMYMDSVGDLYVCGSGGSWRKLAAGGGGGLQVLTSPGRLMDSRGNGAPITHSSQKLAKGEIYTTQVTGQVGVPAGAKAVTGSIAVTQPEAAGYLRLFPAQLASSTTSVINFANGQTIANAFTAALSPDGKLKVQAVDAKTHVIIDITGYVI